MDSPSPAQRSPGPPSRLPFGRPTLAHVEKYAHKALPPLPPPSYPNLRAPRSSRASTEPSERFFRPRAATASELELSAPMHTPTMSLSRSHARRISYSGLSATGRRSSHKVQQLTGCDVDIMEDFPLRNSVDSDVSSNQNQKFDGEPNLVPLLEYDHGDTSSRGSSWAPMSPESAVIPSPLNISKLAIRDMSDSNLGGSFSPDAGVDLDEMSAQGWEPTYRHFSDKMVADEYHRVSVELATQPTRQIKADAPVPARRKRSSLGLSLSAGSRLARWRSTPPRAIDFAMPPLAMPSLALPLLATGNQHEKRSRPPGKPMASQHLAKAAPTSAFDDDSDGEGKHRVREWFGGSSDEHVPSGRPALLGTKGQHHGSAARASHGEQMRELLHQAKDKAKMLHMSKEQRRREELRRQIKVVQS